MAKRGKLKMSSLNPNAASFVPMSEKQTDTLASKGSYDGTKQNHHNPKLGESSLNFNNGGDELPSYEAWVQGQKFHGFYDSDFNIPNGMTAKEYLDEASEMDLAYLSSLFPSLSDQSLESIYSANGDDVDAAIEVLQQLEEPAESSQHLPDNLNTVDVPPLEHKSQAEVDELMRSKKPISAEASESSSSSSSSLSLSGVPP